MKGPIQDITILYNPDLDNFAIGIADREDFERTESELLRHGGIVGDNTSTLIAELRSKPFYAIICRKP